MIYPISCSRGTTQSMLPRTQFVGAQFIAPVPWDQPCPAPGSTISAAPVVGTMLVGFLCTVVSIAGIWAFHTAIFNSFWSRYNNLEFTCPFLQVGVRMPVVGA